MYSILCSQLYKTFRDRFLNFLGQPEEMIAQMQEALQPIAQELGIASFKCIFNAPMTPLDKEGKNLTFHLYRSEQDANEDSTIVKTILTGEHGVSTFNVSPLKGKTFSHDEAEAIDLLINDVFTLIGRTRLISMVRRASSTDLMTGANSRDALIQFGIELAAKNQLKGYVGIFINLKNYKYINKTLSNQVGDEGIRVYVQKVQQFLQERERFARLGGDNFFALIRRAKVIQFIEKFADVEIPYPRDNQWKHFHIKSRMGVYSVKEKDSIRETISNASVALNLAKQSIGKDIVYFSENMLATTIYEKEVSTLFPRALNNLEFSVFYQPKVDLHTKEIIGAEALVRWSRDNGIVPPMDFVPILEKEGTICQLDFFVFETVCEDIRNWLDQGIEPVRISVNFSKVHLQNPYLVDDIISIMNRYDVNGKYLEIEVTEDSDYSDQNALKSFVQKIRKHGVKIAIDDFGTGYSTLEILKNYEVDAIKLDKSLLDHLGENDKHHEIVMKNVVRMINELGIEVIAEGVERPTQLMFLQEICCGKVQGFLYDKPLPHEIFDNKLKNERIYKMAL